MTSTIPSNTTPLPPPPTISTHTIQMAGLLVDVHGLSDLPPTTTHVSCLWLHHQRTRRREDLAGIAARCVGGWNAQVATDLNGKGEGKGKGKGTRGLVALAYDQRNHGSRIVDEKANGSWRDGNGRHAVDMLGLVAGMVVDQGVLIDLVQGYLFPGGEKQIDQHIALGVSLGGHSVWQLLLAEPRVTAGVVVIGCPDYMNLMADRARLSKLPTYSAQDAGASFLGSRDFPPSLIQASQKYDPKAIFFGIDPIPDLSSNSTPSSNDETSRQRQILHTRLANKKILLCSGAIDKLVPYRFSEPFVRWFKQATGVWWPEEGVEVEDRVYEGVGHAFSAEMVRDAVQFVVGVVGGEQLGEERGASKI
ncbi:hypothetical protein B0J18DRAFT_114433 [Chaetomium sp. MPI-SDFR-AT-0129]|nr:hypothetical protein B0J18DRAFT_114433 [Chaetomium sp. MPI-SDFR-AT-0129]